MMLSRSGGNRENASLMEKSRVNNIFYDNRSHVSLESIAMWFSWLAAFPYQNINVSNWYLAYLCLGIVLFVRLEHGPADAGEAPVKYKVEDTEMSTER